MLFGWRLFHKRVELLKSVDQEVQKIVPPYFTSGSEQRIGKWTVLFLSVTEIIPHRCDYIMRTMQECISSKRNNMFDLCKSSQITTMLYLSATCERYFVCHISCLIGAYFIFIFTFSNTGLSRTCSRCMHITHLNCWNVSKIPFCATGCGCACVSVDPDIKRPNHNLNRLVQSPNSVLS